MTSIIPTKTAHDFSLPVLGLGTYQMGGKLEHDLENDDKRDVAAIRTALDCGITHIDTAEIYAAGYSEQLVARAIAASDRSALHITSKVSPGYQRKDEIIAACKESLKRLQTDYLDLYLIHGIAPTVPLDVYMEALDFLYENEAIHKIGVSNFTPPQIEEAQSYTKYPIVNNQIHYNLIAREHVSQGTLQYCKERGILVTAYRPIWFKEQYNDVATAIRPILKRHNASVEQIALAWLIAQENIVTIFKSSNPEHINTNIQSLEINLDAEDMEVLNNHMPHGETMHVYPKA